MRLAAQLTRSRWAPKISLDPAQNIKLHTGARVNVVLLTYLQIPLTKDTKYFEILYGGANTRECWTPNYLHDWAPQYWIIWKSNFGEENGENIWINNINISAIDDYFRSSRFLRAHHAVPSAISSAMVYASRAMPVLTNVLSALTSRRSRISANIGRGRWTPPCCAVGRIIKRRVRVTGVAESCSRVAGSHEPAKPAKPAFCQFWQKKTDVAMLCRRSFDCPTCTCHRWSRLYQHFAGETEILLISARGVGRCHVVPSTVSAIDVYMLPAKPALVNVWALPSPTGRWNRLFADIGRGSRASPCCANVCMLPVNPALVSG